MQLMFVFERVAASLLGATFDCLRMQKFARALSNRGILILAGVCLLNLAGHTNNNRREHHHTGSDSHPLHESDPQLFISPEL